MGLMNIVILGAGKTGAYVAKVLSEESHDVVLVDKDAKILEQTSRESDVATLHASAPCWKIFEDLTEKRPHLFFAATGDDETNLVSCAIAKNLGFPKTIARVKERDYLNHSRLDFGRLFFVDHFIGAEVLAAQDLFNVIVHAGDIAVEHFAHGAIQMRTMQIPNRWDGAGKPIRDLSLPDDLIVGLIRRKMDEGEKVIFPHGDDHILPGDEMTVVGESKVMHRLHEIFDCPEHKVRSVILVGGTPVATHLAHFLIQQRIAVRIIEIDEARCEHLAEVLPSATIINRDGRDPQLLRSERVQDADALVSCTHHDGANLLIASLAKQFGCPKPIALIGDPAYSQVLERAGVLPALSARVNVANRILSILHEETILSIASLSCDAAKIVELKVPPSSPLVGIPLSDLSGHLPKDLLIAVIESRGQVMIGKGNRILSPDDTMILICHSHQIPQIPHLFH
jgi:trk system potassium uptake protein TrkA